MVSRSVKHVTPCCLHVTSAIIMNSYAPVDLIAVYLVLESTGKH